MSKGEMAVIVTISWIAGLVVLAYGSFCPRSYMQS